MTSMDTPTIALQADQLGETGAVNTPSVVPGMPRAAVVTRACAFTPTSDHPVLAALAGRHQLRAETHRSAGDPLVDDHQVGAATRLVSVTDAAFTVLGDRVDMWAVFGGRRLPQVSIATGLVGAA
jgi:hypothetical protein